MEVAKPAVLSATAATVLLSISLNTPVLIPTILSIFLYLHNTFTFGFFNTKRMNRMIWQRIVWHAEVLDRAIVMMEDVSFAMEKKGL